MATLTDVVAAVVMHSSVAAFSHFGVTVEAPPRVEQRAPAASDQRVVARSPRQVQRSAAKVEKANCPDLPRLRPVKA